ncbi:hypothetical protein PS691_05304 [Pseudomonas fluorescens]|uniref:Uncharacterized protein n=1 Tax=Pseudomonas fluorescens TaxID=294 RepID=A0A5E7FEB7_PSEFL|nr:hypothetical protein PS691_05304 [Pseudomonas fluorescens]
MPMMQPRGRSIGRTALIESFPYSDKGALDGSSGQRLCQTGTEPTESYPAHPKVCELQASLLNGAGPRPLISCDAIIWFDHCVRAGFVARVCLWPIFGFGQLPLFRVDQSFRIAPLVCQPSLAGKTRPSSWHSIHTGCPVNEERGRFLSQFVRLQTVWAPLAR